MRRKLTDDKYSDTQFALIQMMARVESGIPTLRENLGDDDVIVQKIAKVQTLLVEALKALDEGGYRINKGKPAGHIDGGTF